MGYKAWGVMVEGIGVTSALGATVWAGGALLADTSLVVVLGQTSFVRAEVGLAAPQLSATELDPLTGAVRAGATQLRLSAKPLVTAAFLSQARARRPTSALGAAATAADTVLTLTPAPPLGAPLFIGEEVVFVDSSAGGDDYNVSRGCGGTLASAHEAGTNAYAQPTYWAGRAVWLVELFLTPERAIASSRVVWRGVLTEAPSTTQSTGQVTLRAESILGTLRRARVNRDPIPHSGVERALAPYRGTLGVQVFGELVEDGELLLRTGVRKQVAWLAAGRWKAMQIGESVVLTRTGVTYTGFPVLGSPQFEEGEQPIPAPYWELAVFSEALDALIFAATGDEGVTPTLSCAYPYHPLTIAAALLAASPDPDTEDPLAYDVLAPQMSLGVPWLLGFSAWDALIARTAHLKVGPLVLAWNGSREEVWTLVTEQLLPAYGFALSSTAAGELVPIEIGLVDLEQYADAPLVEPLPEVWEWTPAAFGALDQIIAEIGALPWREGRRVVVSGGGVRSESAGRATRILDPSSIEVRWPTIPAAAAEQVGATQLAARLVWRYDGLPVVTAALPASEVWELGQIIRLEKPDGLLSSILFDELGARVDDLWDTATLVAQIVSLRPDIERGRYEVRLLLTNYSYGRIAKWRAPGARIAAVIGGGVYTVSGLTSDFAEGDVSDAPTLTVGDEVTLVDSALGHRATSTVTAISDPGGGGAWSVTVSPNFSPAGVAGNWIIAGDSDRYDNTAVVGGEPYPYVWMTDDVTLDRPGSTTSEPDEYS